MDAEKYLESAQKAQSEYESVCRRCGRCCGVGNDPCVKLALQIDGSYLCADYDNRLGKQKTIGGNEFTCVQIRDHVSLGYAIEGCPYFN